MKPCLQLHLSVCFGTVVLDMKTLGFPRPGRPLAHRKNLGVFTTRMDPSPAQVRFGAGVYTPVRECWGQQWQRRLVLGEHRRDWPRGRSYMPGQREASGS